MTSAPQRSPAWTRAVATALLVPMTLAIAAALAACSNGDGGSRPSGDDASDVLGAADGDTGAIDTVSDARTDGSRDATPLPTETCDESRPPIVLVHGFLASGDTWASFGKRFASNGWCADRIVPFDWDSLERDAPVTDLDATIDEVRARFGVETVFLAGHSAGGEIGYDYLASPDRATKVAAYAHIGSFVHDAPAGAPTLNLYSEDDLIVDERGEIPGATNVRLTGVDHYGVATSAEAFAAVYEHFIGAPPETTEIVATDVRLVSGRALSLGANTPLAGGTVEVWEVDAATGFRLRDAPDHVFATDEGGYWGPFAAEQAAYYELRVEGSGDDAIPVHYYREPFVRTDAWVYLRTLPPPGTLAGVLLAQLPLDSTDATLVNFTQSTGVIAGVDELLVDGTNVLSEETAAPEDTTIAMFFYDENGDGESNMEPIPLFGTFPFLAGLDLRIPGDEPRTIEVQYNDRTLRARAWPADTEGATITVFD